MNYNVAQLLKEPIGSQREFSLEEPSAHRGAPPEYAAGRVRMVRTHHGIWVQAALTVRLAQECGRCLAGFVRPLELDVEEEYFPEVDVRTGRRCPPPEDWEGFYIGADHILNLGEAARQCALATLPLKPLCRPECAGICDRCGVDRNLKNCQCHADDIDPRWAALRSLAVNPPAPLP